jgi:hypothetical protein
MPAKCWAKWRTRVTCIVINDEAHHAWRKNPEVKVSGKEAKEAAEEANHLDQRSWTASTRPAVF